MKSFSFSGLRVRLILLGLLAVISALGLIFLTVAAPMEHGMAHSLVWLVLVSLLALTGAWWGRNWLIVGQLKRLMEATEQVGTGDLAARVPVSNGKGELHQLARAFNRMAQGLQHRDVETKRVQDELQRLLRESTALHEQSKRQAVDLEKANKDLRRKEAIQALLKELSQDIASKDVEGLLKKLTDKVCEFFKVDVADVRIIVNGVPRILGVSGIDEEKMQLGRTGSGRGASGWIIENRRPLVIPDITKVDNPPIGRTTRRIGIHGYLAVPFFSRSGEVLGVLRVLSYQPRDFLQEEIDLLQQMTNGAAIALENARLLEQTQTQAAELRQANKVKNEFLGFVSHELRTPVNVIMGYAAILQTKMLGEINAEQNNALEKMSVNSKELLSMIELLLEATKIEAGAAVVEIAEVNLSDFLENLKSAYSVPLKKGIRLHWDWPKNLPVIKTDGGKLRHILMNIIGNAVKYTEQGNVGVSARYLVEQGRVEFVIADTGIGIPKEELPRIFEMFSQVRGARSKSSGGVGLGLHIVKKFTELLGGDVRVASEEGKGSVFTITIPTGRHDGRGRDQRDLRAGESTDAREKETAQRPVPPADS